MLSDVGGFPEVAETGAAELVRGGRRGALARRSGAALRRRARGRLARRERAARARGATRWSAVAAAHLELYERLTAGRGVSVAKAVFWVAPALLVYTQVGYPLLLARSHRRAASGRASRRRSAPSRTSR